MKLVIRGTAVRMTGTFKVLTVLTDPTTVTVEVKAPSGTITSYTYAGAGVTKDSTGVYYRDVTISSEGVWSIRMTGTGSCAVSQISQVEARADVFV